MIEGTAVRVCTHKQQEGNNKQYMLVAGK